jgi:hypothetical protein
MMKPTKLYFLKITQERERRKNKGQGPKSTQANNSKEVGHNEEKEPLKTKPFTKLHEAY